MKRKFDKIIATALEIDLAEIDENMSSDSIPEWDSLKQMNLIVALEDEFQIQFDEDESILLKDYIGLFAAVKNKLKKRQTS